MEKVELDSFEERAVLSPGHAYAVVFGGDVDLRGMLFAPRYGGGGSLLESQLVNGRDVMWVLPAVQIDLREMNRIAASLSESATIRAFYNRIAASRILSRHTDRERLLSIGHAIDNPGETFVNAVGEGASFIGETVATGASSFALPLIPLLAVGFAAFYLHKHT